MGPSIPGPLVLLVDCPTESYLQDLLSVESLSSYYAGSSSNPPESAKTVNCVIHLSPASVVRAPNYQVWMKRFGAAQHIMAGHEMYVTYCLHNHYHHHHHHLLSNSFFQKHIFPYFGSLITDSYVVAHAAIIFD